ncbi:hypothetical protein [Psychromonas sp. MME2]
MSTFALAFGSATKNRDQKIIEAFFPNPLLNPSDDLVAVIAALVGYDNGNKEFTITAQLAEQLAAAFNGVNDTKNADFAIAAAKSAQPLILVILETD